MAKKFIAALLMAIIAVTGILSVTASAAVTVNKKIPAPLVVKHTVIGDIPTSIQLNETGATTYYDTNGTERYIVLELPEGTKGKIYYKTTGMKKYTKYTEPIKLDKNTTIKFYTYSNKQRSVIKTLRYKFATKAYPINPKTGNILALNVYAKEYDITFGHFREGSEIYYTLDGTKATNKSTKWNPGDLIHLSGTTKISVVAYHPDYTCVRSEYVYTIDPDNPSASAGLY